jgi:isoquinoline 1-oxidoreductase beta subunit
VLCELKTASNTQHDARVTKMVVAVDVNRVVNPTGLEAQVISAATDAITTILRTGLHLDNGAIRESSYGDFEIAQMKHTPPEIEVIFMPPNGERPGGAGELVVPAAAAAVANAFARATGIKPRRFPLRDFYEEA